MRSATLSGFGQGAGPVSSVRFEPPEFDPPQAVASRVSASTMNEEQRRILASLGVRAPPATSAASMLHLSMYTTAEPSGVNEPPPGWSPSAERCHARLRSVRLQHDEIVPSQDEQLAPVS